MALPPHNRPARWAELFDQRFHPTAQRSRQLRGWSQALVPLQHADGTRLHWPEDFDRIDPHAALPFLVYVREADQDELGDAVKLAVWAHLRRRRETAQTHDPRIAVQIVDAGPRPALIGQDGVFATAALPRHTILCEYAGLVKTQRTHHAYIDQMEPSLQEQKTVVLNCTSNWDADDPEPMVIDGGIGGNIGAKFNDCRLDPFTAQRRGTAPPLSAAPANCRFVEIILFDWPHVFLMTVNDCYPGTELTVDYGESFWETVRLHEAVQTFSRVARGERGFGDLIDTLAKL